jgi:hypothetical protein
MNLSLRESFRSYKRECRIWGFHTGGYNERTTGRYIPEDSCALQNGSLYR